jgi:hypothetical protein
VEGEGGETGGVEGREGEGRGGEGRNATKFKPAHSHSFPANKGH